MLAPSLVYSSKGHIVALKLTEQKNQLCEDHFSCEL